MRYLKKKTHTHTQMANKITDGRQCHTDIVLITYLYVYYLYHLYILFIDPFPYNCSLIFGVFPNFIKTTFLLDNVKSSLILLRHLNYSCNIGITFVSFDIVVPGLSTFVLFLYLLILCCKPEYFLAALALPWWLTEWLYNIQPLNV